MYVHYIYNICIYIYTHTYICIYIFHFSVILLSIFVKNFLRHKNEPWNDTDYRDTKLWLI